MARRLVEPRDTPLDPVAELHARLLKAKIPVDAHAALARVFKAELELAKAEEVESLLNDFVHRGEQAFTTNTSSQAALLRLIRQRSGPPASSPRLERERTRRFNKLLDAWLKDEAASDFAAAVADFKGARLERDWAFTCLPYRRLLRLGRLDFTRLLDASEIRKLGTEVVPRTYALSRHDLPEAWLYFLGPEALPHLLSWIERLPDEGLGDLLCGVLTSIAWWAHNAHKGAHATNPAPIWERCAPDFARFAEHLRSRLDCHRDDLPFLQAFWWFSWRTFEDRPDLTTDAIRKETCETASRALGKLRPRLRDAAAAAASFPAEWTHLREAVQVLRYGAGESDGDGLWAAMKSLLLAFSSLSAAGVAADLRYWHEAGREPQPPDPWYKIATTLVGTFHAGARTAERGDPLLVKLREEFATFCLERLKTTDGKPVEPRPEWRHCCVRAFRELRAYPRGTAHHVLHHASTNDPDPQVREAAREAYAEARREVMLPPGSSPRRAVLAAFWWLRQGHLMALGVDVDADGAQRTRQKEIRRTKDLEENETPHKN